MSGNVKFVLHRKNFREQILQGVGAAALLGRVAEGAAPGNTQVEVDEVASRARARVYGSMKREAATGELSRAIGRMRL